MPEQLNDFEKGYFKRNKTARVKISWDGDYEEIKLLSKREYVKLLQNPNWSYLTLDLPERKNE
jgi:hypothetical protein